MNVDLPSHLAPVQWTQFALLVCLDGQRCTCLLAEGIPHCRGIACSDFFDKNKVPDSPEFISAGRQMSAFNDYSPEAQ